MTIQNGMVGENRVKFTQLHVRSSDDMKRIRIK
jgi:hypothetical protein